MMIPWTGKTPEPDWWKDVIPYRAGDKIPDCPGWPEYCWWTVNDPKTGETIGYVRGRVPKKTVDRIKTGLW